LPASNIAPLTLPADPDRWQALAAESDLAPAKFAGYSQIKGGNRTCQSPLSSRSIHHHQSQGFYFSHFGAPRGSFANTDRHESAHT